MPGVEAAAQVRAENFKPVLRERRKVDRAHRCAVLQQDQDGPAVQGPEDAVRGPVHPGLRRFVERPEQGEVLPRDAAHVSLRRDRLQPVRERRAVAALLQQRDAPGRQPAQGPLVLRREAQVQHVPREARPGEGQKFCQRRLGVHCNVKAQRLEAAVFGHGLVLDPALRNAAEFEEQQPLVLPGEGLGRALEEHLLRLDPVAVAGVARPGRVQRQGIDKVRIFPIFQLCARSQHGAPPVVFSAPILLPSGPGHKAVLLSGGFVVYYIKRIRPARRKEVFP